MIRRRGLAESTGRNVRDSLLGGRFAAFRRDRAVTALDDLSDQLVVEFFGAVEAVWAPATIRQVRKYLRWLRQWSINELDRDPFSGGAVEQYRPPDESRIAEEEPLTDREVDALVAAARPGRDRLIIELLAVTGMRPSELVALDVQDVRLDRRPPRIDIRQGRRVGRTKTPAGMRPVPVEALGRSAVRSLRRYLEVERGVSGSAALLLSTRGDVRLKQDALKILLQRLSQKTGIHANAYRFRHSVCSRLADGGLPEHALMTMMGWSDRSMIDRYYRRRPEVVLELVARIRA